MAEGIISQAVQKRMRSIGIGLSAVNTFLPGTERSRTVHRSKGKIIPMHVIKV
jgi:hypothetical protein